MQPIAIYFQRIHYRCEVLMGESCIFAKGYNFRFNKQLKNYETYFYTMFRLFAYANFICARLES